MDAAAIGCLFQDQQSDLPESLIATYAARALVHLQPAKSTGIGHLS
jgi:hypothetical protein